MRRRPLRFGLVASTTLFSPTGGARTGSGCRAGKGETLSSAACGFNPRENGSGTETEHRANDRRPKGG
jgi:hypothetical protein